MIQLTADDKPMFVLGGLVEPAEIYDSDGKLLGVFVPDALAEKRALYAKSEALFDPVEIERRKATEQGGVTTKELFEHLLSLTQDEDTREDLQQRIRKLEDEELLEQVRSLIKQEPGRSQLQELVRQHGVTGACATP